MTARAYSVYVGHMREASERAGEFTAGLDYTRFMTDNLAVYATVHALEILGEAAKRVPEDIRAMDPAIPWRQMAGMRDVIIRHYDDVELEEVWNVVKNQIPDLLLRLEELQRTLEQREDKEWERRESVRRITEPDNQSDGHD